VAYAIHVSVTEGCLELREKYVEMLSMRLSDSTDAQSDAQLAQVRARMSALAARFPGSLRELDDLEISEIRRRISELDAVLSGTSEVEPWMQAIALFHRLARGALWAKRWLRGRRSVNASLEAAYAADAETLGFARDALAWSTELAAIARPPGGRVMRLVHARVGRALGVTELEAQRMVFGLPRKRQAGC
jgi:hypothetical protein